MQTVSFLKPGMKIDLGGIAKGHAVDRAVQDLTALGIRHAQVTAGGDMRMLGKRLDRPWRIGIRDPRKPGQIAMTLSLQDQALSTSGDYERSFSKDGTLYHHILDPIGLYTAMLDLELGHHAQVVAEILVQEDDETVEVGIILVP